MKYNDIRDWVLKYNMKHGITIKDWYTTKTHLICEMSDGRTMKIKLSSLK